MTQAVVALVVVLLAAGAGAWRSPRRVLPLALLGAAAAGLGTLALGSGTVLQESLVQAGTMTTTVNWLGKSSALVATVAMAALLCAAGWTRSELGLVRPARGTMLVALGAALVLAGLRGFLAVRSGETTPLDWGNLAFQATLPGIDEELLCRGVFMAIVLRAVGDGRSRETRAILACALLFASLHGIAPRHPMPGHERGLALGGGWELVFEPLLFGRTLVTGLVYGWLRLRTGSVLAPMIAHNAANLAGSAGTMRAV
ncbi:MAG: CPBP family intramembrane glutamic endopeptidase [Phycisphaerales bacterium]